MQGLWGVLWRRIHGEGFEARGREDLFRFGRRVVPGVHVPRGGNDEEDHADEEGREQEQGQNGFHGVPS